MDLEISQLVSQTEKTKSWLDFSGEKVKVDYASSEEINSVTLFHHRNDAFALAEHG